LWFQFFLWPVQRDTNRHIALKSVMIITNSNNSGHTAHLGTWERKLLAADVTED